MAQIQSATFVVRLRVERERPRQWWGEVQRVETGERIAFRDQAKLLAFLEHHLQELGGPATQRR